MGFEQEGGGGGGGSGNVTGPTVAIDRQVAIFDGTTGKVIRDVLAEDDPGGKTVTFRGIAALGDGNVGGGVLVAGGAAPPASEPEGDGGNVDILGGAATTPSVNGSGGTVTIKGGSGKVSDAGFTRILGGDNAEDGDGGDVVILGGACLSGDGDGGGVDLDAGPGVGTGVGGSIAIGENNATGVINIGRTGVGTQVFHLLNVGPSGHATGEGDFAVSGGLSRMIYSGDTDGHLSVIHDNVGDALIRSVNGGGPNPFRLAQISVEAAGAEFLVTTYNSAYSTVDTTDIAVSAELSTNTAQAGGISINSKHATAPVRIATNDTIRMLVTHEGVYFPGATFTFATLPSAATQAGIIYVSDMAGGAGFAFSDGTDWRRFSDRTIVAGAGVPAGRGFSKITSGTARTSAGSPAGAGERILYDPSGGTFTLTAPASPIIATRWAVKNFSADLTAITISGNGSDIEDPTGSFALAATFSLVGNGIAVEWEYTGTKWVVI